MFPRIEVAPGIPLLPSICPACGAKYFGETAIGPDGRGKNDGVTQPEMLQCPLCSLSHTEAVREWQRNVTLLLDHVRRRRK